jgi:hypothetical protein
MEASRSREARRRASSRRDLLRAGKRRELDDTTVVVTARDGRRVPVLDEEREVLAVLASALEQDEYLFHRGQADRD